MKITPIIIILGLLVACDSDNKQVNTKIVVSGIQNIEDTNFVVPKGLLLGKWRESVQWVKQDSTWTGIKSLNLVHEYEFFQNGKLVHREIDIDKSYIV